MRTKRRISVRNLEKPLVAFAFLAAFGFFLFVYPYHLIRREQQTLFLFDWDYIRQTYGGTGWLADLPPY